MAAKPKTRTLSVDRFATCENCRQGWAGGMRSHNDARRHAEKTGHMVSLSLIRMIDYPKASSD